MASAAEHAPVAFVCSTDLSFLHSAFVAAVLPGFGTPAGRRLPHRSRAEVEKLIAAGKWRPAHLFEEVIVRQLDEAMLLTDRRLAEGGVRKPLRVRAATIGAAAEQVGLARDGHVLAAINGDQIRGDAESPLEAGDTVSFISADAGG